MASTALISVRFSFQVDYIYLQVPGSSNASHSGSSGYHTIVSKGATATQISTGVGSTVYAIKPYGTGSYVYFSYDISITSVANYPIKLLQIVSNGKHVYSSDDYKVTVTQRGVEREITYTTDGQQIASLLEGTTAIGIGKYVTPDPPQEEPYSYEVSCGTGIGSAIVRFFRPDGTYVEDTITQSPYYYLRYLLTPFSWISITQATDLNGNQLDRHDWYILKNSSSYEIDDVAFYGIAGKLLKFEVYRNFSYNYNLKIYSGITSYDVYKYDKVLKETTMLGTIRGENIIPAKMYQQIIITNIIPENNKLYIYIYEDTIGQYQHSDGVEANSGLGYEYIISTEERDRFVQVEGRSRNYNAGIKLGTGILSCRVEFSSLSGSFLVSADSGYASVFKTFLISQYDRVDITNITPLSSDYTRPYTLTLHEEEIWMPGSGNIISIPSGNSASYLVEDENYFCVVSASSTLCEVPIETTGIYSAIIYVDGIQKTTIGSSPLAEGTYVTISVSKNALIEIKEINIESHYDRDNFTFYGYDEIRMIIYDEQIDIETGCAFYADSYASVSIDGWLLPDTRCYIKRHQSISAANVSIDGGNTLAVSTSWSSYSAYEDSLISFSSILINTGAGYSTPLALNFYPRQTSDPSLILYTIVFPEGTVPSYYLASDRMYCEITASISYLEIEINTTGIDLAIVYINGTQETTVGSGSLAEGTTVTVQVLSSDVIEISNIEIERHYDIDSFYFYGYNKTGTVIYSSPLNTSTGVSFNGDSYASVELTGQREEQINCYIKRHPSISSANVSIDGGSTFAVSTSWTSYNAYADSSVYFSSVLVNTAEGYTTPLVLKFYPRQTSDPSIRTSATIIQEGTSPGYFITSNKIYCELSASLPEFLWYSTEAEDAEYIKAGNNFKENMSHTMWNNFRAKLQKVSSLFGLNYNYSNVETDEIFYGIGNDNKDFSQVVDAISTIPVSSMTIGHKGTGATVYASYFQGTGPQGNSIKKALNDIIKFFNGN